MRNRRLLLTVYALGTNAGLKRVAAGVADVSIDELAHVHRQYIDADALRAACAREPDVGGAPLRVPMTEELRARLCETSPEGFVPVAVAMTRLGVSRQSIWNRIKSGELASCHVTHGKARGLYVQLPDEADLPLLYRT